MKRARIWRRLAILTVVAAALLVAPAIAGADQTFHGTVTEVRHSGDRFGLHTSHGDYSIYTSHRTDFDGCDWGWMEPGRQVGVRVHHGAGGWVATRVAPWGGGWWDGEHGHSHDGDDDW